MDRARKNGHLEMVTRLLENRTDAHRVSADEDDENEDEIQFILKAIIRKNFLIIQSFPLKSSPDKRNFRRAVWVHWHERDGRRQRSNIERGYGRVLDRHARGSHRASRDCDGQLCVWFVALIQLFLYLAVGLEMRHAIHVLFDPSVHTWNWASEFGHLEVVKWLHENRTEGCTTEAMDYASMNGHLEVVKWLHENRSEGCSARAMDEASMNGHLEVVKWLHENRTEGCTTSAMDYASLKGHLEVVEWLHENRNEGCTPEAMNWASEFGFLEVVKWLHENRSEGCSARAMDEASRNGHLEVVKWLHENRTEGCTTSAMNHASVFGHLEVVTWLLENRSDAHTNAAINFDLDREDL